MDELGIELEAMSEVEKLTVVMEGFCLECGADLKTTEVGGTQVFLQFCPKQEGVVRTEWPMLSSGSMGGIFYVCTKCGQKFGVFKGCGGDWTMDY